MYFWELHCSKMECTNVLNNINCLLQFKLIEPYNIVLDNCLIFILQFSLFILISRIDPTGFEKIYFQETVSILLSG